MAQWFYVQDAAQAGPVEASRLMELLANGVVKGDDLVWREGMANWAEAQSVAELRLAAAAPVPLPAVTADVPMPTFNPVAAAVPASIPVAQYYSAPSPDGLPPSRLGTISLVLGIVALLMEIVCIAYLAIHSSGKGTAPKTVAPAVVLAGLGMFGGIFLCLVGLGLGIAALLQRRKRPFAIIGVVINGAILVLFAALMVIGFLA